MEPYFAADELSRNWFDIADPARILALPAIDIGRPRRLVDRKAVKAAFKDFGVIENIADGSRVVFPTASAGKMLYQSGVALYRKPEGAGPDSHPENPEDGRTTPFIDNKIALFLSAVNGAENGEAEQGEN